MMENEIDRARRDERRQFERDFERRRGLSVGVGIDFESPRHADRLRVKAGGLTD
jgi:hypothetical protein